MGQRGPAPTPTKILKLRGSWRAKRNAEEPEYGQGVECPKRASTNAPAVWRQLAPLLLETGVLTEADVNCFYRYCVLFSRWWNLTMRSKHVEADKLHDQLNKLEAKFGLDPANRSRIHAKPAKKPEGAMKYRKTGT